MSMEAWSHVVSQPALEKIFSALHLFLPSRPECAHQAADKNESLLYFSMLDIRPRIPYANNIPGS